MIKRISSASANMVLLYLLTACSNRPDTVVSILQHENSSAKVRAVDWDEGFELFAEPSATDSEKTKILESAICRNVTIFWADERTVAVNYDELEATYFSGSSLQGYDVDICRRGSNRCLPEPTTALKMRGCSR